MEKKNSSVLVQLLGREDTGMKYIMDAAPVLPAHADHMQSAAWFMM